MFGQRRGFLYEGLAFDEEEAFSFTVLLLFELGEPFKGSSGDHMSEGSKLSSSFLGPPTTSMSPS